MKGLSTQLQQIDLNTQQNAAMVEESNAAARGLSDQAANMAHIVGKFAFERRESLRDSEEAELKDGHDRSPFAEKAA